MNDRHISHNKFRIEIIESIELFRNLREEWNTLLSNSATKSVFLTWDWLYFCHKNMKGKNENLFIILIRDGLKLMGIAPFVLVKRKIIGKQKIFLEFLQQRHSYHLGIICQKGFERLICESIFTFLFSSDEWNLFSFIHLQDSTLFNEKLTAYANRYGSDVCVELFDPCKVIELSPTFDQYLLTLSANARSNIRRNIKKLQKDFLIDFDIYNDLNSLEEYWPVFLELHRENIAMKGRNTVFNDNRFVQFYYQVLRHFASEENIRINLLKLDSRIEAIQLCVIHDKSIYFLNMGKRTSLPSRYGLGTSLLAMSIENSIKEGFKFYDLLGGGGDYKDRFGGIAQGGHSIQVFRSKQNYWKYRFREIVRDKIIKYRLKTILRPIRWR